MTGWITRLCLLAALGIPAAGAQNPPLVVGLTLSRTGAHADLAAGYGKGLRLWEEEANAGGGVLGRRVELRVLDDASEALRAGALYRQLIADNADALIGPYGSAATLMAAAEAETAQRVLINGAGWSRAIHKRTPRYIFQSAVPYGAYGAGVLDVARSAGISTAVILARDDPAALEMATAARERALGLGLAVGALEVYADNTLDFGAFVARAQAAGAQAWIAFGEVRDAAEMVKTFKRVGYAPALFFASAASNAALVPLVGQDAELALGATPYSAASPTTRNRRFVHAYKARWDEAPDAAAAEGYAAGEVLEAGLRKAGAAEQGRLRAALASLETETVLGPFKVDPATGEQVAATPLVTQVLHGRAQPVWPAPRRAAVPVLPYPQWAAREYYK